MPNFPSKIHYRLKYGIRIYTNVLKEQERLRFLRDLSQYLRKVVNSDRIFPGLQTRTDLHTQLSPENYFTLLKLMKRCGFKDVSSSWVYYSGANYPDNGWHTHKAKLTSIYYMENPEGFGTMFKHKGEEFQIDVPTNTLMVFPGNIEHSSPSGVTVPRYSFVFDD